MKKIILILSAIIAIASCGNQDEKMVRDYLKGHNNSLFPDPKIEITNCENLGMQYSPGEILTSIRLKKASAYSNGAKALNEALKENNRAKRREAINDVINTLTEVYENDDLQTVANIITMPERSNTLYPDKVNRIAIKATYTIDGSENEDVFYLERDGKSIGSSVSEYFSAYYDAVDIDNKIYSLITQAKECLRY